MRPTCELRLTRYYEASPEDVWGALTEPESVARWLAPHEVEFAPDRPFALHVDRERAITGRVRAFERARLLELDWLDGGDEPSVVRFELSADGERTKLVLDHRRVDAAVGMRELSAWSRRVARLDRLVQKTAQLA